MVTRLILIQQLSVSIILNKKMNDIVLTRSENHPLIQTCDLELYPGITSSSLQNLLPTPFFVSLFAYPHSLSWTVQMHEVTTSMYFAKNLKLYLVKVQDRSSVSMDDFRSALGQCHYFSYWVLCWQTIVVSGSNVSPFVIRFEKLQNIDIFLIFVISANLVCPVEGYNPIFIKNGPTIRIQHTINVENSY